ncbi:hypothetical protein [Winogradskyella eximia]|jgi:hypothetical protein|uniref:hypothetical protein n=1 Tax=Winogradskyella eximia TaxID=262006 RepID=UPI002492DFEE|nr:hypothetical protein [Winogradskyella eximia]
MSNIDPIKDLYYTFGSNFLGASILYFPKNLFELISEENFSSDTWSKFTNKIFVFEENGNNYFIENELVSIKIIPKKNLLESNIFQLLKLREEFLPVTFSYILKKYKEHLNAYKIISQWLIDNVSENVVNLTNDQRTAFEIQNNAFLSHDIELKEIFGSFTKDISKIKESEKNITIGETLNVVLESQHQNQFNAIGNKNVKPTANRKIRRIQIKELTNSYADELILKQIFDVDINTI